jgi:UDP-2-acetamido-2,6-beta-L-arabino-hexul-4-ose reductase
MDTSSNSEITFSNKVLGPVFSDQRGDIYDILEDVDIAHVGMVTFKKGVVRGNHYHLISTQYSFVLEGSIKLTISSIDGSEKQEFTLQPGSLSTIPPQKVHTYEALTDARMLDLTTLGRNDNGYEKDTVKLSV